MASTVFVDGSTPIVAAWANDVNSCVYNILGNGTTIPANGPTALFNMGLGSTSGATYVGFENSAFGATARTVASKLMDVVCILDFGGVGDGSTDNTNAINYAASSLSSSGGMIYFPPSANTYNFANAITLPNNVGILGAGKWTTSLKYTGTGTAFVGTAIGNSTRMENFSLYLSGTGSIGFDCKYWIYSTWTSVRVASSVGPSASQYGVYANISNVSWTSYFNSFYDCHFDNLNEAVYLNSSVSQYANRWQFHGPLFTNCNNNFDLQGVQGIQIISPTFNQNTGYAFKLGAHCDSPFIYGSVMESDVGGTMWSVNAACNRLTVFGYRIYAGTDGSGAGLGIRATVFGTFDNLLNVTGSSTATYVSQIAADGNLGLQVSGIQGISSTTTMPANLSGRNAFAATNVCVVTLPNTEADTNYFITLGSYANETLWISAKTTTSFTVMSSNAVSTAPFNWIVAR